MEHLLAWTLLTYLGLLTSSVFLVFDSPIEQVFACLFIFRYYRLLVGVVAYCSHGATRVPERPAYSPSDVTVIIPTVTPWGHEFTQTVISALRSECASVIVVVPEGVMARLDLGALPGCGDRVMLCRCPVANKRRQVSVGLAKVKTSIVCLCDNHVFWPNGFLRTILAPFEDPNVGGVAMWKRVTRKYAAPFTSADFWNFIGSLYLERHNFDLTASHSIDGGLFVISGRTAAYRSSIICNQQFIQCFCNERWFFGQVGPLNADDDNFITRWLVARGWKLGWQHGPLATMETPLGESGFTKFNAQCLRWVRTTWRSNSTSLFADRTVWRSQPWSVYAVYVTSFCNFALLTDALLVYLCHSAWGDTSFILLWILLTKLVKPLPHFLRHPRDLIYLPAYIGFGYYHSVLKLYALFTVGNVTWGSRPGLVK